MLSASGTYISKTAKNIRVFTSDIYNAVSGAKLYTKTKTSSNGGSISSLYHHYLKSTPTDMFVTMLAEVKANFFGKSISNISGSYSRNSFIVVSKPVISKNLNYALLEIGRINYYDISSYVLKVDSYATTFDLILYKKEKGKWKQLELIHRLYWKK